MSSFTLQFLVRGFLVLRLGILARGANTSDAVCQELNTAYDGELLLPQETGYLSLAKENWSATAIKAPSCIFQPTNANDLAQVVKQLGVKGIKFAIRSGGHLPSPGAASIDDGVLIDLGGFNQVKYNAQENTATVGSGTRWKAVYEQLNEFNVTVAGGRVLDVGIGGLILGSGLSYLSDLYGLACDNVVNFEVCTPHFEALKLLKDAEVVLGEGKVLNANSTDNKDLFWALKGGSNNFGIVTRFTLSTYPNPQVWGGVKSYALEDLPALYSAMYEYQTTSPKDPKANIMMQGYFTNSSATVILNMIYLAPETSPSAFDPFYHINTTSDSTSIASLSAFLASQGPLNFPPRVDWRATSFLPDKALYEKLPKLITASEALKSIEGVDSGTVSFGLQPISTSAVQAGVARGGNALGLQNTNQTWFVIDSGWGDAKDDALVYDATKTFVDGVVKKEAENAGKHVRYVFMNDASYDQDVIGSYGSENVARMRTVSKKYDPKQVFQLLVPGGFKIPAK